MSVGETSSAISPDAFIAGELLSNEREKKAWSVARCADALKISPRKLSALESGDIAAFESEVFFKGYLRNYARLLQLCEQEVLYYYESRRSHIISPQKLTSANDAKKSGFTKLCYLLIALIIAFWVMLHHQATLKNFIGFLGKPQVSLKYAPDLLIISRVDIPWTITHFLKARALTDAFPPWQAPVVEPMKPLSVKAVIDSNDHLFSEQPIALEVMEEVRAEHKKVQKTQTPPPIDKLLFNFTEVCWLEVSDASGDVLVSGLQSAASVLTLQGSAPFYVVLGNIRGTSLKLNNQTVPLTNSPDGRTLRFTVGTEPNE